MNEHVTNYDLAKRYSETAHSVWRQIQGCGLAFYFQFAPNDGLTEALTELRQQGKIFEYRYEPRGQYHYVSFEIPAPTDGDEPVTDGDFDSVLAVAEVINSFFPAPQD